MLSTHSLSLLPMEQMYMIKNATSSNIAIMHFLKVAELPILFVWIQKSEQKHFLFLLHAHIVCMPIALTV